MCCICPRKDSYICSKKHFLQFLENLLYLFDDANRMKNETSSNEKNSGACPEERKCFFFD